MDPLDLPALYNTKDYADCTLVSADGEEFRAHRVVLGRFPALKERIEQAAEPERRVQLTEPSSIVQRMLQWMYGIDWVPESADSMRQAVSMELTNVMDVCEAAEKYAMPKLAEEAYNVAGHFIGKIESVEDGLRTLRDISVGGTAMGALQRTIIDRTLSLLPGDEHAVPPQPTMTNNTIRGNDLPITPGNFTLGSASSNVKVSSNVVVKPKRSGRPRTPSAKAKELGAALKKARSKKKEANQGEHCICRVAECPYLVLCEDCNRWFHPNCIGKGLYAPSMYKRIKGGGREKDEKKYRTKNLRFTCLDCDLNGA